MAVIASVQSVSTAKTLLVFCFDVFVATIVFFIITPKVKYNYLKLAEEAYLRAIEIEDRYVRALYGLGVLYVFELDEPAKSIPHLEKALTIDTKNIDAMFVLARAYYSNYEFDKSAQMYDKIINTTKSAEKKATAEENKKTVLDAAYSN